VVSDFDETKAIMEAMGITFVTFQESRRETWKLGEVEVVLDEWPWLDPYIEIEGESEELVKEAAAQLGFSWENAVFGSTNVAYAAQYPLGEDPSNLISLNEVRFGAPLPEIFQAAKDAVK